MIIQGSGMEKNWKENLSAVFEELRIIQASIKEILGNFDQFCEFIAEPAFESLSEELKQYGIKSSLKRIKGKSIDFQINFKKSRKAHFHYIICLPENSVELRMKLFIKGRKERKSVMKQKEKLFMEKFGPKDIMKLSKECLIEDVIAHYRVFNFETLINP